MKGWWLAAVAVLAAGCGGGRPAAPGYDWGVAYYMPYDNDLAPLGPAIIEQIRQGVSGTRSVAAVQADFADTGGMRRYVMAGGSVAETALPTEDSASEDTAAEYLGWFVQAYPCRHYVVVFLDHGGRVDEMCADDHPGSAGRRWMSGQALGEKLRALKAQMAGRWELLFLQQCARGTLENLYSFRGTADYILCSPVDIGAPNTYYAALHRWLAGGPDAAGDAVAARIAAEDRDYTLYTCVRTAALAELPARLDGALAPLLARQALAAPARPAAIAAAGGDEMVDAQAYLQRLAAANGAGSAEGDAFFAWAQAELLAGAWRRGASADGLCGFGLYVPAAPADAERYAGLDLYRESRLPELWRRLAQ